MLFAQLACVLVTTRMMQQGQILYACFCVQLRCLLRSVTAAVRTLHDLMKGFYSCVAFTAMTLPGRHSLMAGGRNISLEETFIA
jgi:hypothetical protein